MEVHYPRLPYPPEAPNASALNNVETFWKEEGVTTTPKRSFKTWASTSWALVSHCILSIGITLFVLVYVEGRHFNVTSRTPLVQTVGGTRTTAFIPRQSDIVTFLSSIIAVLKCALTAWAASLCWRIALFLMEKRGLTRQDLKVLLNYGLLAPGAYSVNWSTPVIGALLLVTLVATFSSPLLTGSITWVPSNQPARGLSLDPIAFDSVEHRPLTKLPDIYLHQGYIREAWILQGAGLVNIGWGRDTEKGVLKLVSRSVEVLAINSTVENITVPYFRVHSIRWIEDANEIPEVRDRGPVGILDKHRDAVPIRVNLLPFDSTVLVPNATSPIQHWSNDSLEMVTMQDTALLIMSYADHNPLGDFNLTQDLPHGIHTGSFGFLKFAFAWVTYSAGVGRCKEYQCLISSPSTIQTATPIDLEPHQLTRQAFSLATLVSFSLVAQNASLPSPWSNINDYVEAVLVRSYSGAWNALNTQMRTGYTYSNYVPSLPGLLAHVDRKRVYIWLGIQLLVTLLGVLFMIIQFRLSKYPLIGDTTFAAFYLDTTGIPGHEISTQSKPRRLFKIEPQGDRLRVRLKRRDSFVHWFQPRRPLAKMRLERFGVQTWIQGSGGKVLDEYQVARTDVNTIECWIPSQAANKFCIVYSRLGVRTRIGRVLSCTPYLDGEKIGRLTARSDRLLNGASEKITGISVGSNTHLPFEFKTRDFIEGDPTTQEASIRVEFEWGKTSRRAPAKKGTGKERSAGDYLDKFGPTRKKGVFAGHVDAVGLGAPVTLGRISRVRRKCRRGKRGGRYRFEPNPDLGVGVFIFRYAARAWLEAKGIAPRSISSPSKPAPEDIIDVDAIESDDSDSDVECTGHIRVVTETITTTRTYTVDVPLDEQPQLGAKTKRNVKAEAKPSTMPSSTEPPITPNPSQSQSMSVASKQKNTQHTSSQSQVDLSRSSHISPHRAQSMAIKTVSE